MKRFLAFMLLGVFALPALAGTTRTTTTSTYEETAAGPVMKSDMNSTDTSSDMIEAEEYDESLSTDEVDQARWDNEQQRMEDSSMIESEEAVDYSDRTRTERARKALNTGSNASDDQ